MLGYGIGTGPPGVGVLQTSGIVAIDIHESPLCTSPFSTPLTLMVAMSAVPPNRAQQRGASIPVYRASPDQVRSTRGVPLVARHTRQQDRERSRRRADVPPAVSGREKIRRAHEPLAGAEHGEPVFVSTVRL